MQRTLPAGFIAPASQPEPISCHLADDGFRIIARKTGAQVRLYSRPGNDLTRRFPLIVETLARLRSRSCIINSEAVACDDNGVALFNRVRYRHHDETIFFYAFALIELNGDDLRADPLEGRKATPEMILAKAGAGIRFREHMEGDGEAVPRPCFGQPRQGPPARPAIPNHERGNHKSVSLASKALAPTGRTRPTSQAAQ